LSKLPNLDVKPRSTVFRYKGKDTDPHTIAAELNVQAILNGRVSERGQEISLFVELIDVAQDKVVWSQQYSRKQDDLVDLQSEIARDVSSRLKPKISDAEETKVTKTYTTSSEAYQLYLKGNFYLSKYSEDGVKRGIEYFNQAIAADPNYALAYHGIANAYDFENGFFMRPKEAGPKAKAAALKALEIDDSLAETHFLLGKIMFWYDWDFAAAEREWKRANELDPSYPPSYPLYLAAIGKYDEAIKMQETLLRRTPLDLNMNMDMAGVLLASGKVDQSIEQNKKALELDPDSWWANQQLGMAYMQKGLARDAVRTMEKARTLEVNSPTLGYLGYAYGKTGRKEDAERVLEELKELSNNRYISPIGFVLVYAGIGDRDRAFEWLDRAFQEREPSLTLLTFDPALESLRPDPRFKEFLDRVNLPE
jgi:tetratricopeptide (TPR) repeat protein